MQRMGLLVSALLLELSRSMSSQMGMQRRAFIIFGAPLPIRKLDSSSLGAMLQALVRRPSKSSICIRFA